ncbi:MAG: threonine/serine exporter family protein, partial [Chloroflexi bacterium]|nr:threonine/serine exporter family protein [Chloroflexota bacterium]
ITTAFVSGVIASLAKVSGLLDDASTALAASVLLLVPGVPLINAAEDLIKGHNVTGIARALIGGLIAMAIALGLLMAITITGVTGGL